MMQLQENTSYRLNVFVPDPLIKRNDLLIATQFYKNKKQTYEDYHHIFLQFCSSACRIWCCVPVSSQRLHKVPRCLRKKLEMNLLARSCKNGEQRQNGHNTRLVCLSALGLMVIFLKTHTASFKKKKPQLLTLQAGVV